MKKKIVNELHCKSAALVETALLIAIFNVVNFKAPRMRSYAKPVGVK